MQVIATSQLSHKSVLPSSSFCHCLNSLFLDDNKTSGNGYGKENGKKRTRLLVTKQQLRTSITLFVHFLAVVIAVVASLRRDTSLFHVSALWSWWTQHKKKILFLNSNTDLSDSTPDYFVQILQINWNWMRSMKFETERIHFLLTLPWQSDVTTSMLCRVT